VKSLSLTPEGIAQAREILARDFSKAEWRAALRDLADGRRFHTRGFLQVYWT